MNHTTPARSLFILGIVVLLLSACARIFPDVPEETEEPEPEEIVAPVVSATGVVVPLNWATLSLSLAGVIEDLEVRAGQQVQAGDLLVRLEGEESMLAAISAAQYELFSAEQALQDLFEDHEVLVAEANDRVVKLEQDLRDGQRYLDNLQAPAPEGDINQARANLILAKEKLERAEKDYRPYEKKQGDNIKRATYLSKLAQAQKDYEAAVRHLNNLEGRPSELTMRDAETELVLIQAQLASARARAETLLEGPDPDDVQAAEERVANAKVQLDAAAAAEDDLILQAPFTGTISEVYVRSNEWVGPGQPILLLADLSHLRIETTDLNEIDVARIAVGDTAIVSFDALPEVVVTGKVVRIASKAASGAGVNYPVVVDLDEIPDELRWGMTAFVDVEVAH